MNVHSVGIILLHSRWIACASSPSPVAQSMLSMAASSNLVCIKPWLFGVSELRLLNQRSNGIACPTHSATTDFEHVSNAPIDVVVCDVWICSALLLYVTDYYFSVLLCRCVTTVDRQCMRPV